MNQRTFFLFLNGGMASLGIIQALVAAIEGNVLVALVFAGLGLANGFVWALWLAHG